LHPATRRLHRKRLQLRIINGNLCPWRLTHLVTTPMTIRPALSLAFEALSTVLLPERGLFQALPQIW
jgi:hypothetical protein